MSFELVFVLEASRDEGLMTLLIQEPLSLFQRKVRGKGETERRYSVGWERKRDPFRIRAFQDVRHRLLDVLSFEGREREPPLSLSLSFLHQREDC